MKTSGIIFALVILLVGSSFGLAQEQPPNADYSWLNGRWEGTLFDGGRGIISLKVVNGNQVEGYERMALGGSVSHLAKNTQLAGTVDGNRVVLRRATGMGYILTFADGTLTGYVRRKGGKVETTFKKMHGTD